jgi:hypothetical protein
METFTTLIVNKMKDANMFAGQGGPIILTQVCIYTYRYLSSSHSCIVTDKTIQ